LPFGHSETKNEEEMCLNHWFSDMHNNSSTHLSKGTSGLKQKCTQPPTSFFGTVFHALSHDVIHFVPRVSSKNLEMEVPDWLLKNFNQ